AFVERIITNYMGNTQPIILEYLRASFVLGTTMVALLTPSLDRILISPEADRHVFSGSCQALEPLDRDEPVDLFQYRPQLSCNFKIWLHHPLTGLELKYDYNHDTSSQRLYRRSISRRAAHNVTLLSDLCYWIIVTQYITDVLSG